MSVQSIERKYRKYLSSFATQLATSAGNLGLTVILIQNMGLEAFGIFSMCFLLIMTSRNFLNGTILVPLSINLPNIPQTNKSIRKYNGFIISNYVIYSIVSMTLISTILYSLHKTTAFQYPATTILLTAVTAAAAGVFEIVRRYLLLSEESYAAFLIEILRFLLLYASLQIIKLFQGADTSPNSALASILVTYLLSAAIYSRIVLPIKFDRAALRFYMRKHKRYIIWMSPAIALQSIQGIGPYIIGSYLLNEMEIGTARALQQISNILNLPNNALQQIVPSIGSTILRKNGSHALRRLLIYITALSTAGLAAISLSIIYTWDDYLSAQMSLDGNATKVLLAYFLALNISMLLRLPLQLWMQVTGAPQNQTFGNLLAATLGVPLSFILIERLGVVGIPLSAIGMVLISTAFLYLTISPKGKKLGD